MQTYRCKCGKSESFGSLGPDRCHGCSECGTALLNVYYVYLRYGDWPVPEPHDFVVGWVETDEGDKPLSRCRFCHQTRRQIEADAEYDLEQEISIRAQARPAYLDDPMLAHGYEWGAPHCDDLVLHAPGQCEYCDKVPRWQAWRVENGVNFTGEKDPNKKPCPAEVVRGDDCQVWHGNKPYLEE